MIKGSFDNGSPFIEGLLVFPGLNIHGPISFLLDTGADETCIMPTDGRRLRIDYGALTGRKVPIRGVSGSIITTKRPALIFFTEDTGKVRVYRIQIDIMPDEPELYGLHSLLGQDILSRWRTVHDPTRGLDEAVQARQSLAVPLSQRPSLEDCLLGADV